MRRVDARRNRERILDAARRAFAEADAEVSLAEVSRRAGVGMATLYRNFPNRLALLEALYAAEADAAFGAAEWSGAGDPEDALRRWLQQFFLFAAGKKQIAAELLTQVDADSRIFDDTRSRVTAAGRPLFEAAQRAGHVREGLSLEQVLQMLVAIATIDGDTTQQQPLLDIVLDGIKVPPPDEGERAM